MSFSSPLKRSTVALSTILGCLVCVGVGCGGGSQTEPAANTPPPIPTTESEGFGGAEVSDDSGTLDILSDRPTEVLLDGKPIGKTPITNYKAMPGPHDVTFVDEAGGNRTMSVTLNAGDHQTVKSDPAPAIKEAPADEGGKKK
ncbi:PEGA domain-containing protein [Polyangium aurulentum]|uniref:PEGA domain-containing protein n=1 Tax=Polyangium aurulentum TaxID=2567896 RepID=UPI0010AE2AEF|nr:PEGA domain-containing protein [Polyangium aurulentum]UQA56400.1 PEGA domain-containing protein [Polyangium aurulentum]